MCGMFRHALQVLISGINRIRFWRLLPGFISVLFLLYWLICGWSLELVPLGGIIVIYFVSSCMERYVFGNSNKSVLLQIERLWICPRYQGADISMFFLGKALWGTSVMLFALTLLGSIVLASYTLLQFSQWNIEFSSSFFILALFVAIPYYFNQTVPQTDILIERTLEGSFGKLVRVIKCIFAATSAFGVVLTAGATAAIIMCPPSLGSLSYIIYLSSSALVSGIFNVYATHYLTGTATAGDSRDEIKTFATAATVYIGIFSTLLLLVIYVPAICITELRYGESEFNIKEVVAVLGPGSIGLLSALFVRRGK